MISKVKIYGLAQSVAASKYPMNTDTDKCAFKVTGVTNKLATCPTGEGHDNFLNGIIVQFDLTMSVKMSVEAERYHFLDFVSSQSTMHRITQFDLDGAYTEYTDSRVIDIMKELVDDYNADPTPEKYLKVLYTNPCGFRLTARMTTNYRQLKTIYKQRKNHRLPEWREFCAWIETLPLSEWITGQEPVHRYKQPALCEICKNGIEYKTHISLGCSPDECEICFLHDDEEVGCQCVTIPCGGICSNFEIRQDSFPDMYV